MTPLLLSELMFQMRQYAWSHPFNNDGPPHPLYGIPIVDEGCHRTVEVDGRDLEVTFSLDLFPSMGRKLWHLTIGWGDRSPLDEALAGELVAAFLPDGAIRLDPLAFPPEMRSLQQYVAEAS